MMRYRFLIVMLATWSLAHLQLPAEGLEVLSAEAQIDFPNQIIFSLQAQSDATVEVVELEYGLKESACTTNLNRVVPDDYERDVKVNISWTWNMRRTGSLPPGARIWWRWHLVDASGRELRTETQWLTWIDAIYDWKTISTDDLVLHWYEGDESFVQMLLDSAIRSQTRLEADIGALIEDQVHIYIYADTDDMLEAILFEPGWAGALAFPPSGIVIIGVNEFNLEWGLDTIAHELAHVIVGNAVSHCYSVLPTWLDEGLAVYAEGDLDPSLQRILEEAIAEDELFSIRSLSDGFTEHANRAYLSYAESYSIVSFLIETYGREAIHDLLEAFQSGYRYDSALSQIYGFDADGLEAEWRAEVGASALTTSVEAIDPTSTIFPTIHPYAGPPVAVTSTPLPAVQLTPTVSDASSAEPSPTPSYAGCFIGLGVLSVFGLVVLAFILHRFEKSTEDHASG
jgi:hypothetical protein